MRFSIQQNTIQGKRHANQDRMGHIYTKDALLLIVCDGLGGHGNGEKAAFWALETLAHRFQYYAKPLIYDPIIFLESSILAAHKRILKKTPLEQLSTQPRTTIVCALIQSGKLWIAHCGDSRAYHIREGKTIVRTRDHSKIQFLIDTGKIKASDVKPNHPDRNRLINCLGSESPPVIEHTGPFKLLENDIILLCTDGVWGNLNDIQLLKIINQSNLSKALPFLVHHASQAGGTYADDATGLAVKWLSDDLESQLTYSEHRKESLKSTIDFTSTKTFNNNILIEKETEEIEDSTIDIREVLAKFNAP